jgi:energy-coupling factor transport system ATP-binding protein
VTVVIVTHDVEFAAACADRCALFFRGEVVSIGTPRRFFSENRFYTTAASRMTKGYFDNAVTMDDVVALCLENGRREGGADD